MESGTLDIFTEQSHLSALDNLLFSRNLCETVNFYLVESAIFWYLNYCCSRQHEVCFLILEIENFPADEIFFSSYSSQLLHYHLRSSYVISSFFTWKFPSPSSIITYCEKPSPMHSDSFSLNAHSSPKDQLFDKESHDKICFLRHSQKAWKYCI